MNCLPLTEAETGAVALTMLNLAMLTNGSGRPQQPELIPGREGDCIAAQLGVPFMAWDDTVRAYVDAHRRYISWHPENPAGISAHKVVTSGWIITAAEATAALATLDRASLGQVRTTAEKHFAEHQVKLEIWDDWIKILRGSADSGYPIHAADPDYDGPWMIAELLFDGENTTSA